MLSVNDRANLLKLLSKRGSILTSTLRNRSDSYKTELINEMAEECIPAFESQEIKPIIDRVFNMTEA